MHSARPSSLGFAIFVASGHWRRGSMPRTSRRRNATASRTIPSSTVRGQRAPPSFAQCPHGPAAGSLSSRPEELHPALRRVDVRLHRRELPPARLEHPRDPRLVLLPGHRRPHEAAAVLRDGAVDLEQLERLLDLPVRQVHLGLEAADRRRVDLLQRREDLLHPRRRRERGREEVLGDRVVLATRQQDPVRALDRPPGAADLLVVGDRRARALVVDDEAEVGLVEAHPEGDRRDQRLEPVREQVLLERLALLGGDVGAVRTGVDAAALEPARDPLGVGDREAVDDPGAGHRREVLGEPGEALRLVAQRDRVEVQRCRARAARG